MQLPDEYLGPELMAIGDSMYNGVRALSINDDKAEESPPVFIASALGLPFRRAEYPALFLYDLELLIYGGILEDLNTLSSHVIKRAEAMLNGKNWSDKLTFDNIANGGATINSLYTDTYEDHIKKTDDIIQLMKSKKGLPALAHLGDLWYSLNAAYLLNPSRSENNAFQRRTFVDWVGVRKPKRLLINIGSNEGLFRSCFTGEWSETIQTSIADIPNKARELAEQLLPAVRGVDKIYYNSLVRPRAVPNIGPRSDFAHPITCDAYFPSYVARIIQNGNSISGEEMKQFDELIREVNAETKSVLEEVLGDKVHFVDLYTMSAKYDGKHNCHPGSVVITKSTKTLRLSNHPLTGILWRDRGGLSSLDNMHPSVVGYGLMAQAVLDVICRVESRQAGQINLQSLYERDEILQRFPIGLELTKGLLGIATSFISLFKVTAPE
ncbi:SGNH/GDSL hydrolase family protein [Azospirillum argentinense]